MIAPGGMLVPMKGSTIAKHEEWLHLCMDELAKETFLLDAHNL
jgi:hypothetical protein